MSLFGWLLLRAFAQAALVIILARMLGANGYGLFVAILAIAGFFAPLAGLGFAGLLLRDGAREPENMPQRLGMALALWWPATLLFTLIGVVAITTTLPTSVPLIALTTFSFSEIVATTFVELAARVEQSRHHVSRFGGLLAGLPLARLAGLMLYAMVLSPDPVGWIWVYAICSLAYTAAVAWSLLQRYRPLWPLQRDWKMAREGFPFTVKALSYRLQAEFNKPVLARVGYEFAANFSVAQRMIDVVSLPLQAMQEVFWPKMYAEKDKFVRFYFFGLSFFTIGVLAGFLMLGVAPFISILIGPGFEGVVSAVVWLAWLPALQVLRNLQNAVFIARGAHNELVKIYIYSCFSGIFFTATLVPLLGVVGAAYSIYIGELTGLIVFVFYHFKNNGFKK